MGFGMHVSFTLANLADAARATGSHRYSTDTMCITLAMVSISDEMALSTKRQPVASAHHVTNPSSLACMCLLWLQWRVCFHQDAPVSTALWRGLQGQLPGCTAPTMPATPRPVGVSYQITQRRPCLPRCVILAPMQGSMMHCCSMSKAANSFAHTPQPAPLHQ